MKGEFNKSSAEFQMMTDYYNLIKDNWVIEDKDKYWIDVVKKANEFCKKYDADTNGFAERIAYAFLCHIEQLHRDSRQNNQKASNSKKKTKDEYFIIEIKRK